MFRVIPSLVDSVSVNNLYFIEKKDKNSPIFLDELI